MLFPLLFSEFWVDIVAGIVVGVALLIITAVIYFFRNEIKKWWYSRKIKPIYEPLMSAYEEKVLPDYVEVRPQIKVQLRKEDLPKEHPFGYIFVPADNMDRAMDVLLACIPVSCSLKGIRILFDEKLRKSLFNYLSFRLGLETEKEERAVKFRDVALEEYPGEYEVVEKLYEEGKLTGIVLNEAIIRLRKSKGKPSTSDVKEFSKLVRKLVEIDVTVIRVGDKPIQFYVNQALESKRGAVLLARGRYTYRAIEVSGRLREIGFELYSPDELGFENPETGVWHFLHPKEYDVALLRIWLKRVQK